MSQWYYADRNRQRQGPIEAAELAALFRRNEVGPDTLVWRDGLPQWQVLGDFAGELGLFGDAAAAAPEPSSAPSADAVAASGEFENDNGRAVFDASEPGYPAAEPAYAEPSTPYAPPSANVATAGIAFHGGEVVYAGFWKRYAAMCIDGFLMAIVFWGIALVGLMAVGSSLTGLGTDLATGVAAPMLVLGIYVVPIVLQAVYFTWMHASGSQATLGKLAVGIKVTDALGQPIAMGKSFWRWVAYTFFNLLSCGIVSVVSAFTAGLSERKQAVHDMACGTLVVDKWAFTEHPDWQRRELGTVTIVIIVLSVLATIAYVVGVGAMVAATSGR